jgi:elongation factor G
VLSQNMNKPPELPLDKIRVLGVFAHIDAGKTTTSEAILYYTGRIHRIGSVDEGSTQLDWMEQERARGITITAAATTCEWQGHHLNLIDTPGHIDFSAEVVRSVRVIDGAVIVLCGVGGVETQTETVWGHAERENLPRLLFVNKLDRMGADFERVLGEIHQRLTKHAVALQIPVGNEDSFHGVIDLLKQSALLWPPAGNGASDADPVEAAIPSEYTERTAAARALLLDAICETDENLLAMRLEGHEPRWEDYQSALRKAVLKGKLIPVLCGSAKNRMGIQPLLDAVIAYLPAPVDAPPVIGAVPGVEGELAERFSDPAAPFCATAFKIIGDPHVGHLTWVRVFSGSLRTSEWVYNPRTAAKDRVDRIYRIHANRRELVNHMQAGDVMALVGIKTAATGDTLCDPAQPIELDPFTFPEPVITVALAPATPDERERLRQVMKRLCAEDPTLLAGYDPETQEETLSGMGELHLEIAVDRMRTEFGITPRASPPQVAYRETVRARATATGDYRKQTGGHGHFAVVRLRVEPLQRGQGVVLDSKASPAELPENFVRNAQGGIREALAKGILAGYPVTDVRVTILGGRYHEIDSNALDFHIAGSMAVRQALHQAHPALLEPVMRADMRVSEAALGTVMADFTRRRGNIYDLQMRANQRHILGDVPLAEVRGYVTALRDMTSGRGDFTLELRSYDIVPDSLAEAVIEERQARGKVSMR